MNKYLNIFFPAEKLDIVLKALSFILETGEGITCKGILNNHWCYITLEKWEI